MAKLQQAAAAGNKDAQAALQAYQQSGQKQPRGIQGVSQFDQTNATNAADRHKQLVSSAAQAPTVISQLTNIATLADRAITGSEADKRAYANGLLSLVGVGAASDAKTATDLLNKNANQIIATLGSGGLGTDAARAIVAAGNPNNHMTTEAIKEAAAQLTGVWKMTQSKAAHLNRFTGDQNEYQKQESLFNSVADPRVYHLQMMSPDQQRAFIKSLKPADAANMLKSRQTLMGMGAL